MSISKGREPSVFWIAKQLYKKLFLLFMPVSVIFFIIYLRQYFQILLQRYGLVKICAKCLRRV